MSSVFGNLGFATCTFEDCSRLETRQIFEAISKVNFEPSFKCTFIHWSGHGRKGYFKVTDGEISINEIKSILSAKISPTLKDTVKILFCDSCRNKTDPEPIEQTATEENLVIVYSSPLHQQSYSYTEDGLGIATKELMKLLLKQQKDCNLLTFLSTDLTKNVKEAGLQISSDFDWRTDFEGSISYDIDLYKNKLMSRELF